MKHRPCWLIVFFIFVTNLCSGQQDNFSHSVTADTEISFRDTVRTIAIDSLVNDLGVIMPVDGPVYFVKHFKYIGTEEIRITKTWTGDPHYICEYPKEILIPNKIYALKICLSHQARAGTVNKQLGFDLSDGNRIRLQLKGRYKTAN